MNEQVSSPLCLEAMTLRGIGSYLRGARLDIRPVTILCGKNGSGKSTWFKALNMLQGWAEAGTFPFPPEDNRHDRLVNSYEGLTNVNLLGMHPDDLDTEQELSWLQDSPSEYGPLGTIGLHFRAVDGFELSKPAESSLPLDSTINPGYLFLEHGRVVSGTRFRLRIAHPGLLWVGDYHLDDVVELCLNDGHKVEFRRPVEPRGVNAASFSLRCSRAFLTAGGDDVLERAADNLESPVARRARLRIRQLFDLLISGYFFLGAVRKIHTDVDVEPSQPDLPRTVRPRYVGREGERTLAVERAFARNELRQVRPPFSGGLRQQFDLGHIGEDLLVVADLLDPNSPTEASPVQRRLLDLASESAKREVLAKAARHRRARRGPGHDRSGGDKAECPPAAEQLEDEHDSLSGLRAAIAALLNEFLPRQDVHLASEWPEAGDLDRANIRREFDTALTKFFQHSPEPSGDRASSASPSADKVECAVPVPSTPLAEMLAAVAAADAPADFATLKQTVLQEAAALLASDRQDRGNASVADVLTLCWQLIEAPRGPLPPQQGTTTGWLLKLRWLIDNPPPGDQTRQRAQTLRRLLRDLIDSTPPGPEAAFLIAQGIEYLQKDDLHRLNRLIIEAAFCAPDSSQYRLPSFLVADEVSRILHSLVEVRLADEPWATFDESWPFTLPRGSRDVNLRTRISPSVLVHDQPMPSRLYHVLRWTCPCKNPETFMESENWRPGLEIFVHPCFEAPEAFRPAVPKQLSAGFHQVAPIVIQSVLMRTCEMLAVENPEVHLHPSLQLQLAGFLLDQSKAGKLIIVETHSDLVIRRVLRAILEEEVPQEQVRIYFTELEPAEGSFQYSTLTPLQVNNKGQIDNWPAGFMDDDVRESSRLLSAMYGSAREDEWDESEDDDEHQDEDQIE